jgi:stage V sporulation protein B
MSDRPAESDLRTNASKPEGTPQGDAAAPASPAAPAAGDVARTAGRGGLAITGAKIYFMFVGTVQQIALPRVLGLDGYGALSSALSIASTTYNPVVTTSIQGASRAITMSSPEEAPAALRRVFVVHTVFAVFLSAAFFALGPVLARAIGAPHISTALRILSGVMLMYGLYTPLVGALNGQRRFLNQAALDVIAATLRTIGLVVGSWWFVKRFAHGGATDADIAGMNGASWGFLASSTLILTVALFMVGIGRRGPGGPSVAQHLVFVLPILAGQVALNFLLQADLTLLRLFAADSAKAAGLPLTAADPLVGAYRATQLFSFLPYQLLLAVTFILFPMLGVAVREGDRVAIARYVKTGVRLALVMAGAMVSVTAGLSDALIHLVFGEEAAHYGGRSLELLALGFGVFAIFAILTTVLNSLKRELAGAIVTLVAFALVVGLCVLRVRGAPFGEDLLFRTAVATSSGLCLATLLAAWLVRRSAGAVVEPKTLARVVVAVAVAVTVGRYMPYWGKAGTLLQAVVVAAIYALMLLVSREVGKADLDMVRHVLSPKSSKA